mmetsp:Transcript_13740/g.16648  ORF Transcript_13740/g.16648 Transcript_13740/m.16648 type:complete len:252 (-) Transcript_13740:51-806(-)|eukprot:CAMPEP_0184042696 /NCGR_PEP_ID=MMETSP0955-20130417/66498_1 /TAXON_ID=627963 /ORGANISM="Aplanochytrium sp, Strain PBS07" /LENGTH=251 /DNA_ID=CAMNT_0026333501 /DNA_START=440 /DNA_END=1195 /DNA_ORIENTATION=+
MSSAAWISSLYPGSVSDMESFMSEDLSRVFDHEDDGLGDYFDNLNEDSMAGLVGSPERQTTTDVFGFDLDVPIYDSAAKLSSATKPRKRKFHTFDNFERDHKASSPFQDMYDTIQQYSEQYDENMYCNYYPVVNPVLSEDRSNVDVGMNIQADTEKAKALTAERKKISSTSKENRENNLKKKNTGNKDKKAPAGCRRKPQNKPNRKRQKPCKHGRMNNGYYCQECPGKGICPHKKSRSRCKICRPNGPKRR